MHCLPTCRNATYLTALLHQLHGDGRSLDPSVATKKVGRKENSPRADLRPAQQISPEIETACYGREMG
jgi:hypothetical protein